MSDRHDAAVGLDRTRAAPTIAWEGEENGGWSKAIRPLIAKCVVKPVLMDDGQEYCYCIRRRLRVCGASN